MWVRSVPANESLHVRPSSTGHRFEMSDGLAPADDGETLSSVLDGIEEVSEVAGGLGSGHIRHNIRLSDLMISSLTR